jgi:hypothetical protein
MRTKPIKNWYPCAEQDDGPRISGDTAAGPIVTSPIQQVLDLSGHMVVQTKSGSLYVLQHASGGELNYTEDTYHPFTAEDLEEAGFIFPEENMAGWEETETGPVVWHAERHGDGYEATATEDRPSMVRFAEAKGETVTEAKDAAIAALVARIRRDRGCRPVAVGFNDGKPQLIMV